ARQHREEHPGVLVGELEEQVGEHSPWDVSLLVDGSSITATGPYRGMSTNRDRAPWNATGMSPVGPFLCFATTMSAPPARGCSLSYMSSRWMSSTMSASCSIEPDSRRSEIIGRLSVRCSEERFSCDSAITGTWFSFASSLSERENSETSC